MALAATVDPDDPWSHPDAAALDALSFAGWMREQGARPAVLRLHELGALAMAGGSIERQSLLGQLRMVSAAGAEEVYGYERWEGLRLSTGSASLAAAHGRRPRRPACASARRSRRCDVAPSGVRVTLAGGEELTAGDRRLRAAGRAAARHRGHRRERRAPREPAPPAPGARGEDRRGLPGADLARGRGERPLRRRGHRRLDLAPGPRRALDARGPGAPRALPGRAAARPPRRGARHARAPLRRGRAQRPTRCSTARGAPTRSRRATSRSGRRAT